MKQEGRQRRRWACWVVSAALVLAACSFFYFSAPDATPIQPVVAVSSSGVAVVETAASDQARLKTPISANPGLLEQIRHHEVDFISLLNDIRERCLPDWTPRHCNEMTRDFLRDKFQADNDVAELLSVYDQYIQYEDYVAEHRAIHNLDVDAAHETLQRLREQFIAPEVRQWLFGAGDARMAYEFALQDFIRETAPRLAPLQRLQALDALRRQTLGGYHDLFVEREDPLLYDETRLHLLQLSELNTPEERAVAADLQARILARSGQSGDELR